MIKAKRLASLVVLSGATLAATPAHAALCAAVSIASSPATINYNPITAAAAVTTTFTVTVGNKVSTNDATFRLIFTDSASAATLNIGTAGPQYSILNSGGQVVSFPSGSTALGQPGVTAVSFTGVPLTLTYTISLPVNSGTDFTSTATPFTENLSYSLMCYKGNGQSQGADAGSITSINSLITNVLSVITASPQTLNFGNFTTTSQNLNVNIKSTNTINVAVSTAKGSVMALNGAVAPYAANNSIPYTMTFNGAALASTATNNVVRASVAGANYPFALNLTGGLPTGKLAGTYSDVITLTITPGA